MQRAARRPRREALCESFGVKAEDLLLEAYPGLMPPPDVDTIEAIEYLIKLYDATGQTDKAAEWRAKLPTEQAPND